MRSLLIGLLLITVSVPAFAADRRGREPDECSRRTAQCEQQCDTQSGMNRLSCKTECRLAESQCRNSQRR